MKTNAQLVRLEAGDRGTPIRDVSDGDGASTEFFLSAPPILGGSAVVQVGGVTKATPDDYSLNEDTGHLTFVLPPTSGDENIVVTYWAVSLADSDIAEACRQYGLDGTATATTGASAAVLQAAAMACDWRASDAAQDFDFDADGQSYKRGTVARAWADRAAALRARVQSTFGLTSLPVTRLDGYAVRGEYSTRDLGTSTQNPRRTFYGTPDNPF